MHHNKECKWWHFANHLGIFFVLLFAICFAWYFLHSAEREIHMAMFNMSYFGWSGMNFASFVLGAVQSYIWAYIFVGVWHLAGLGCKCKNGKCE